MPDPYTKPFKGMLLNQEKIGDIATCVCPPYDVISNVRAYYQRNKYNVVRLELPIQRPALDKYNAAKETLQKWLQKGILVFDNSDSIYIYEQKYEIEHRSYLRRGFIALNRLDKSRILTHEETRKKAKEDRERLINTLKTYTSHIFGLYEDKEQIIEDILINSRKEIMYDFVDEQSITNRLYRMHHRDDINRLVHEMDNKNIYIADGHHRLEVSYRLNLPYIPLYLTNMYSEGIAILPYHRIINFKNRRNTNQILELLKAHVAVEKIPLTVGGSTAKAMEDISGSAEPAYLMYSKDDPASLYLLKIKGVVPMDKDMHESLKKLKVNILHNGILKGLLNIHDDEISFTQELYESVSLIKQGMADLAFFLPPTTVEEVKDIADHGLYMPPKSTFFYPKILTGMVFYKYE